MVNTIHIDRWDITKILIDNGSQVEILFLSAFEKMGYEQRHLKEPMKPLYRFGGKKIEPVGSKLYLFPLEPHRILTPNTSPLMLLTCFIHTMPSLEEASSILSKLPYT
jgi:hypothetical protein